MKKNGLSKELSKRLGSYGLTALAVASVGSVANGQIVHTADVNDTIRLGESLELDFNADGVGDVTFSIEKNPRNIESSWGDFLWTKGAPATGNRAIASFIYQGSYIKNLAVGDLISADVDSLKVQGDVTPHYINDDGFHGGASLLNHVGFTSWGNYAAGWDGYGLGFQNPGNEGYLGYEFKIDGSAYYGWVKVKVDYSLEIVPKGTDYDISMVIEEYAYESTDYSIKAGDNGLVGINKEKNVRASLDIFPNPTADFARIRLSQEDQYGISVIDVTGKEIASDNFFGSEYSLSVIEFNKGVYFVRVSNQTQSFINRVVVE